MAVKLMDVPKCMLLPEGYQKKKLARIRRDFFSNTHQYIESVFGVGSHMDFKRKYAEFNFEDSNVTNKLTSIVWRDEYIFAGCIETRTLNNDKQYTFFRDLSCIE
jgi:hypothetical protein